MYTGLVSLCNGTGKWSGDKTQLPCHYVKSNHHNDYVVKRKAENIFFAEKQPSKIRAIRISSSNKKFMAMTFHENEAQTKLE